MGIPYTPFSDKSTCFSCASGRPILSWIIPDDHFVNQHRCRKSPSNHPFSIGKSSTFHWPCSSIFHASLPQGKFETTRRCCFSFGSFRCPKCRKGVLRSKEFCPSVFLFIVEWMYNQWNYNIGIYRIYWNIALYGIPLIS